VLNLGADLLLVLLSVLAVRSLQFENNEAARVWISGMEAVNRKLGLSRVIDLSAPPSFLRGSGYAEGTLFPWTMSDSRSWMPSNAASSSCRASRWGS
jgi:hypothetical protein